MNGDRWLVDQIRKELSDDNGSKAKVKEFLFQEQKTRLIRRMAYNYDYSTINPKASTNELKDYILKNKIKDKIIKVVKNASEFGIAGILKRVAGERIISQNVSILSAPRYHNEILKEAWLSVDTIDLENYDEENLETMKLWLNEDGNYVLSHFKVFKNEEDDAFDFANGEIIKIKQGDDEEDLLAEYVYEDFITCPLTILENNESAKSDWSYASETLRLFTKFDAILETEWEYLKVQLLNNLMLGGDKTGQQFQQVIESGKERVHDIADIDGLSGQALSLLSAGGMTAEIARQIKVNYKEEFDELTFALGKLSGGNNKHTTEAIMSNIDAFNYLAIKREYLLTFLTEYFTGLNEYITKSVASKPTETEIIETTIKYSKALELVLSSAEQAAQPKQPMQKQNTLDQKEA